MYACRLCGNLSVKPPSPDTKTVISVWKYQCALKRSFQQRGVSFPSYLCQLCFPSLPEKTADWFRIITRDASSSLQGYLKLVIPSAFTIASRHTGLWVQGRELQSWLDRTEALLPQAPANTLCKGNLRSWSCQKEAILLILHGCWSKEPGVQGGPSLSCTRLMLSWEGHWDRNGAGCLRGTGGRTSVNPSAAMWTGAFQEEGTRCVRQMIPWVELQQQQTLGGDRGICSTRCSVCKMDIKTKVQQLGEGHCLH